MAEQPPHEPPPEADGIDDDDSYDDDDEDIVTRLHVMPERGVTGPYPGAVVAKKYLLKNEIAKGGMGSVWRAIDIALERPVAVKFMDPRIVEDEELKKRFAREAKAAARLTTPHVVQVYEYGIEGGIPFIAMELLEGEDLHERLKREGPLDLDLVADIVSQIARGLRSAQDAKVVHRDLKPQNIFLADEGGSLLVKILDFGVAKIRAAAERGDETKAGTVLGSPHYMSPEQARGRPEIDHRADIWSLGVIAFRALTGKMAFPGEAPGEVILRICTDPIPVPSEYNSALPKAVDEIFDRVLDREPETRYQSALEFAAGLERVARLASPQHRAPTTPMQAIPEGTFGAAAASGMGPAQQQPVGPMPGGAVAPGGAMAAVAKQATPWPTDGTPASAIQAAPGKAQHSGSSSIQSVPQQGGGMEGGTPSSAVQALQSPPLDQAPAPAVIKRGGSADGSAPAWNAAPAAPAGTPQPTSSQPGTPVPGSAPQPLPSDPGTPPSPLLVSPLPYDGTSAPASARGGIAAAPAALGDSSDGWPAADSGGAVAGSGEYPNLLGDSGEHPSLFADEVDDDIEAPTVVAGPMPGIGGAVAPPPDVPMLDEELSAPPQRGLSVIVGVAAAGVVLLLIASVLMFGQPEETEIDVTSAPLPSTLIEPASTTPPAGEATTSEPPETTTRGDGETTADEEAETSSATSEPSAKPAEQETEDEDEPSRPPRPRRPRASDEWGY